MGIDPAGCVDETALMGGAEAWASGNHAYSVTDASGDDPAFLTVMGTGAFIALPKAFNGGEHATPEPQVDGSITYTVHSYVNDGTSELLVLTVDIPGGFWTYTLISE